MHFEHASLSFQMCWTLQRHGRERRGCALELVSLGCGHAASLGWRALAPGHLHKLEAFTHCNLVGSLLSLAGKRASAARHAARAGCQPRPFKPFRLCNW